MVRVPATRDLDGADDGLDTGQGHVVSIQARDLLKPLLRVLYSNRTWITAEKSPDDR